MTLPWDTVPAAAVQTVSDPQRNASTDGKPHHHTVIVGAGLAGCWLARILAEQGVSVCLLDQYEEAASAASGNPAGIVKPYVTRSPCLAMSFHDAAHRFLLDRLTRWQLTEDAGFKPCGVLQLVQQAYPTSESYTAQDAQTASERAGVALRSNAIEFPDSGWLNPQALCRTLVRHPLINVRFGTIVKQLQPPTVCDGDVVWRLNLNCGIPLYAQRVVLACGAATDLVPGAQYLPLIPARGQLSRFALSTPAKPPSCVINGKHYVIPDESSILVGATFQRHQLNPAISETDHASNLAGLQQLLPELRVEPDAVKGYAGIRSTTPDRLPVAGPIPDFAAAIDQYGDLHHGRAHAQYSQLPVINGLFILGGLGSRGIVTAPLCAQLLAELLTATPESVTQWTAWAPLINPVRFLIRNLKRGITTPEHS